MLRAMSADATLVPGELLAHAVGWLLIPTVGPAVAVSGVIVGIAWKDRRMQRKEAESSPEDDGTRGAEQTEVKSDRGALGVVRWAAAAVAVGLVSACGSGGATSPPDPSSAPQPAASSPATAEHDSPVKVDVIIAGGDVRPRAARVKVKVGQKIVFAVTSDVAEELHVHSDPAQSFKIQPGPYQEFTFTIDVPGQVEVEAEGSGISIATLVVRP